MNRKIKLTIIIALLFILIQISTLTYAKEKSCISNLEIEINMYELSEDGKEFIKSGYQQYSKGFVREDDYMFVENLYIKINPSCITNNINQEKIILKFKKPNSNKFGDDIDISLQITNPKIDDYSIKLVDINRFNQNKYVDSLGNSIDIPSKKFNMEGTWKVSIFYEGKQKPQGNYFFIWNGRTENLKLIISGGEIKVNSRVTVDILNTLDNIRKESKNSTKIAILALFVAIASILIMRHYGKEQLNQNREYYEKRQLNLLKSLYTELNTISDEKNKIEIINEEIKGNLQWFNEQFRKRNRPAHNIWYINTTEYLSKLDNKVKDIDIIELKKTIILINQKISMINSIRDPIKNKKEAGELVEEAIKIVEKAKRFIKDNFDK